MAAGGGLGNQVENETQLLSGPLDSFKRARLETQLVRGRELTFIPTNINTDPIVFNVTPMQNAYYFLKSTRVYGKARLVANDGQPWNIAQEIIGPIHLFGQSLWSSVEVEIQNYPNSKLVNEAYPFKAHLESMLSFGKDSQDSDIMTWGFAPDTPGYASSVAAGNMGYDSRRTRARNGRQFEFDVQLLQDFMQSERYLIPNLTVNIKLFRSSPNFYLHGDAAAVARGFKIVFDELELYANFIETIPSVLSLQLKKHQSEPVRMILSKAGTRRYDLEAGKHGKNFELSRGPIPKQLILCFLKSTSYLGDMRTSPFHFEHFNMSSIQLRVNADNVPSSPMRFNFGVSNLNGAAAANPDLRPDAMYYKHYVYCMKNLGLIGNGVSTTWLTPSRWVRGNFILAFDFSPDNCAGYHIHAHKGSGTISCNVEFSNALQEEVTCLSYEIHDSEYKIDYKGDVTCDIIE